ncbi:sulfurtransferase [Sulfurimonas diazotrophicus]|uniref:Rhodanese-like domain-containing protein n=1 Tax=Sulfurimonas diazotrophicus TaxID=3131939 RepID=A0ABZ3HCY9_9BACT
MRNLMMLMALAVTLAAMEPVVTGEWLVKHAGDKNLVIVDVSAPEAYEEGHIPGARNASIELWRHGVGKHAEVRSAAELQAQMRRLGIGSDSKVVVYSHHLDNKDLLRATYVLWAMEYAGFKKSALLDGGLSAYTAAGGKLSDTATAEGSGDVTVATDAGMIATLDEVKASRGKVAMIDSRPAVFYFGAEKQGVLKRAGHISGAHSYFWRYNVTPNNRLKPKVELSAMLEEGLGLDKDAPLIVYCTGGLEASMNYFVVHRVLGFAQAKLYDASMKEWANRDDTPMRVFVWE